ncbi:MAG: nuc [Thermoleophilia bacterium]|nr:nuc [Thermoleophilia bacterium]
MASVTDGDTIRLRSGERVRLVQVDAPEARGDVECWGPQASAAMRRLLRPGDRVTLERDPALDGVDGYGRLLRYVTSPDGTLLNTALVASGDAVPYFFRGDRGRHADRLLAAARSARSDRLGLWGACRRARLTPDLGYRE